MFIKLQTVWRPTLVSVQEGCNLGLENTTSSTSPEVVGVDTGARRTGMGQADVIPEYYLPDFVSGCISPNYSTSSMLGKPA